MKYNDGSLSPILIPTEDAGYLMSLALDPTEDQIQLKNERAAYLEKEI